MGKTISHRRGEFEIEQQIFLGGQISNKYPEFQTIARVSPEYAEIVLLIDHIDKLKKESDPLIATRNILVLFGEIEFMAGCTELTKLSAVMGDTRKQYSAKGLKDELKEHAARTAGNSPT